MDLSDPRTPVLLVIAFILAVAAIGWCLNIVKLFGMAARNEPGGTRFVMRLIGVPVFPVGAIMGLFI